MCFARERDSFQVRLDFMHVAGFIDYWLKATCFFEKSLPEITGEHIGMLFCDKFRTWKERLGEKLRNVNKTKQYRSRQDSNLRGETPMDF